MLDRKTRALLALHQHHDEGGPGGSLAWDDITGKPATFPPTVPIPKADVGLANADNTSDANKPVSSAQQAALDLKAPITSPTFLGTPSAPTPSAATNSTVLATTAFVQGLIASLIASAPGALDTLDELAAAFGDDPNFAATMTTALAGKQGADATLTALAGLAGGANKLPYFTGADVLAQADFTSQARDLLDDTSFGAMLSTLGLTANGQSLVTAADYAAMRTLLGLVIGTNVQAFDQQLTDLAALSYAGNASKVVAVNAAANGFELVTPASGSGPSSVHMAADAAARGAAIADYFASTLLLDAGSTYDINCHANFLKTTAGTLTWTWAFSNAPTMATSRIEATPVTGFTGATITGAPVQAQATSKAQATMAHAASGSLTTAVDHSFIFWARVRTNLATTIQLRSTESAGTITPRAGSYMSALKIA